MQNPRTKCFNQIEKSLIEAKNYQMDQLDIIIEQRDEINDLKNAISQLQSQLESQNQANMLQNELNRAEFTNIIENLK